MIAWNGEHFHDFTPFLQPELQPLASFCRLPQWPQEKYSTSALTNRGASQALHDTVRVFIGMVLRRNSRAIHLILITHIPYFVDLVFE